MPVYFITLKKPETEDNIFNYRMWVGLHRKYKTAEKRAMGLFPGYEIKTYARCKWWQLILSLSIFEKDLNKK